MKVGIENVRKMLDRFGKCLGTCDKCEWTPYTPKLGIPDGFEMGVDRSGMVRRCESCATSPRYPWVGSLDAERVRQWMQERIDTGNDTAFAADELKVLL